MMLLHQCTTPNPHIRALNQNFELEGYPVVFGSEIWDIGKGSSFGAVASFAFGGSNARSDVWARAQRGPRKMGKKGVLSSSEAFKWLKDATEENVFPFMKEPKLSIDFRSDMS